MAVATTSTISTTTRMLVKRSAISFSVTTPKPCNADPSRRMEFSFVGLEVARIDRFEARLVDRQAQQPPPGPDHRSRGFRADIVIGQEQKPVAVPPLDPLHAGDRGDPFG
jgi:hypothetical protein